MFTVLRIHYLGVSKNRGTPKSSILIGLSVINHPFWGTIIFGNTHFLWIFIHFFHLIFMVGPSVDDQVYLFRLLRR